MYWNGMSSADIKAFESARTRVLPCPFCGRTPSIHVSDYGRDVLIGCDCLGIRTPRCNTPDEGPYGHLEQALTFWNHRTPKEKP